MGRKQTIAVDFDNTIATYDGWGDGQIHGEEMPGAFNALLTLINRGYDVVILTARPADQVNAWMLLKWPFKMFPVPKATNTKPPAVVYIDDRAIKFENWKEILLLDELFPKV